MDPIRKRELKRQAFMRLSAQRRRAGLLRGRVVAISLLCFVVLWGIVFAQMATGNDPVLSAKTKTVASRTAGASKARRREVEANSRVLGPPRQSEGVEPTGEEEVEAEPEEGFVEEEPAVEEVEEEPAFVEEEAAVEEPEFVEEPLVTSQS